MIPYSRQSINSKDIESVKKTLLSDFLTQGPATFRFEKLISKLTKCKYVVSTNSASSALHVACLALELKKMILFGQFQILSLQVLIVH